MKTLLVAVVLVISIAVTTAHEQRFSEVEKKVMKECMATHEVSFDQIKEAHGAKEEDEVVDAVLCFFKCVAEASGSLVDGKLTEEGIKELKEMGRLNDDCDVANIEIKECADFKKIIPCLKGE